MSYYQRNRDVLLSYQIQYNNENREHVKSYYKDWYEENKHIIAQKRKEKNAVLKVKRAEERAKKRELRIQLQQQRKEEKAQQQIEYILSSEFETHKSHIKEELKMEIEPFQGFKRTKDGFVLVFD